MIASRGKLDYYNLSHNCHKGNLVVSPHKGTAIMWYNHLLDEESGWLGPRDEYSLHGGCDILKGEKWIAITGSRHHTRMGPIFQVHG